MQLSPSISVGNAGGKSTVFSGVYLGLESGSGIVFQTKQENNSFENNKSGECGTFFFYSACIF